MRTVREVSYQTGVNIIGQPTVVIHTIEEKPIKHGKSTQIIRAREQALNYIFKSNI